MEREGGSTPSSRSANYHAGGVITINQYEQYIQSKGWDNHFRYMLLSRMRSDCEYFLSYGCRCDKHLWANNVADQIGYMKALWNSFAEDGKPAWLTMEHILDYEKKMLPALPSQAESVGKVVIGRPVNGISINSSLEFVLNDDGAVWYFDSIEQAREVLRQNGVPDEEMGFYTFLYSCGVCSQCGAPLFPSLLEGYACQCFDCNEDFYSIEQDVTPV